jgi:hypothetical protein
MFVTANRIDLAVNTQTISIQRIGFERGVAAQFAYHVTRCRRRV